MTVISFHLPPWFWPIWHLGERCIDPNSFKMKKKKSHGKKPVELNSDINALKYWLGYKYTYKQLIKSFYHVWGNFKSHCQFWKEMAKLATLISDTSHVSIVTTIWMVCLRLTFKFTYSLSLAFSHCGKDHAEWDSLNKSRLKAVKLIQMSEIPLLGFLSRYGVLSPLLN